MYDSVYLAKCSCQMSSKDGQIQKPSGIPMDFSEKSVKKAISKHPYIVQDHPELHSSSKALPSRSIYRGSIDNPRDPISPARDYRAQDSKGRLYESPSQGSRHRFDVNDSREPRTPLRGRPIRKIASRTVLIPGNLAADSQVDLADIPGIEIAEASPLQAEGSPAGHGMMRWSRQTNKEDTGNLPPITPSRKRILSENIEESPAMLSRFNEKRLRTFSMTKITPFNNDISGFSSPGLKMNFAIKFARPGTSDNLDSPGLPPMLNDLNRGRSLKVTGPAPKKTMKTTNFLIPEDISDDSQESKKEAETPQNRKVERKPTQFCSSIVRNVSLKPMAEIPEEDQQIDRLRKVDSKNESNAQNTEATKDGKIVVVATTKSKSAFTNLNRISNNA